jgi:peptidylprolyl isomerase
LENRPAENLSLLFSSEHERGLKMKTDRRSFVAAGSALVLSPLLLSQNVKAQADDPQNTVFLDTKDGRVTIRLRPDLAPKHVAQIKTLVSQGFYDGIVFHRVIDGFMAQTGDPTGTGMGGSKLPNIPAEFNQAPFRRGTLGMARANDPNSANSQFFICFAEAAFLNGNYTVFGEVVSGMEVVDKIKKGAANANGQVQNPDKIIKMQLASQAK